MNPANMARATQVATETTSYVNATAPSTEPEEISPSTTTTTTEAATVRTEVDRAIEGVRTININITLNV